MTDDLSAWLRAQLDADEQWARAASQAYRYASPPATPPPTGVHWTWVIGDNWDPISPDPVTEEYLGENWRGGGGATWLATVEEWPSTTVGVTWMMRQAYGPVEEMDSSVAGHIVRWDPARVLAEIDAKRRIIDLHPYAGLLSAPESCESCAAHPGPCLHLRLLALPYADRSGYDESWRP